MKELVKLKNVSLTYQTKTSETLAIDNLNLSIYEGEFVAIVGPSGCGKTTILSLISKVLLPTKGTVEIYSKNDKNITGYMFQHDHLFGWRSIMKNITLGPEIQKSNNGSVKSYAELLLRKYGLYEYKDRYPNELSGGMRQRVALIRTLVLKPEILLLDEPFSALDFQTRLDVCDDVSNIIKQEKKTAVLVTHDLSEAISMADRVIVLSTRPAKVKNIFTINLKEYGPPLKRREHPDFSKLFDKIWKEVKTDEKQSISRKKTLSEKTKK